MTAVLQRVDHAACTVKEGPTGQIGEGLMILLGVAVRDTNDDAAGLAAKIARCRIFCDEEGKMNRSLLDVGGSALVISNFTLLADYSHGNRPSYFGAAAPEQANLLYEHFMECLSEEGVKVERGKFGAHMRLELLANGPVTIVMESDKLKPKKESGT